MSKQPRPDPYEEPTRLQDEITTPVDRGEDYKGYTPRRDLAGEATEADVLDQAAVVGEGDEYDAPELG